MSTASTLTNPSVLGEQDEKRALARVLEQSYKDVDDELDRDLTVRGELPAALNGVYFRNGPGKLGVGEQRYDHPFDGDGMIARFDFDGRGGVHYRNRFVRTKEWRDERDAGEMLYRGFGSQLPGGAMRNAFKMRFKNAANTAVVWHGGRLMALWEGGLPHTLDPVTLETLERFDFGGKLQNKLSMIDRKLNPELPFSAHPRVDARTGELFNFGIAHGVTSRLMLYTVDADGEMTERTWMEMDKLFFAHDFVLTPNWRIFFMPPVSFQLGRALAGLESPASCLTYEPDRPMEAILIHREDPTRRVRIDCAPGFIFHFVNGYETHGGDRVVVDGLKMPDIPDTAFWDAILKGRPPAQYPHPTLTRYELDLTQKAVTETALTTAAMEFPMVRADQEGTPHDAAWFVASPEHHAVPHQSALARWDASTGDVRMHDLWPDMPGEPVHVEDPTEESAGWILSVVYRSATHTSDLCVFEADTLDLCATVALPHHLPPGFHGSWAPREDFEAS